MKNTLIKFSGLLMLLSMSGVACAQPASDTTGNAQTEQQPAVPGLNFSGTGLPLGEVHKGELVSDHPQMPDYTHADCFQFEATEGERYRFTLRSDDFDSYLLIGVGFCQDVMLQFENNDFESGSTDARLEITAEYPFYSVYINTFLPETTGHYSLLIEQLPVTESGE